jgi:hypothetical protein
MVSNGDNVSSGPGGSWWLGYRAEKVSSWALNKEGLGSQKGGWGPPDIVDSQH